MGVFYDPFVLTTALSLVSGSYVQWKSFSEEMPELLIADLGPHLRDLQVCLQPHVYVAQPQNEVHAEELTTYQKAARSSGKGRHQNSGRIDLRDWRGMDSDFLDRRRRQGNPSRYLRGNESVDQSYSEGEGQLPYGKRESGGVKDTSLFQRFLNDDAPQTPQAPQSLQVPPVNTGYNFFEPHQSKVGSVASSSLLNTGRQPSNAFTNIPVQSDPARPGRDLLTGDEASGGFQSSWLNMMKPVSLSRPNAP